MVISYNGLSASVSYAYVMCKKINLTNIKLDILTKRIL